MSWVIYPRPNKKTYVMKINPLAKIPKVLYHRKAGMIIRHEEDKK